MAATPTYIIGHKNPDADSICSAIGYAAFKAAKGESGYLAARCGNSNARIDAILRKFDVPLPTFIGDVTPRVRDIMVESERMLKINPDATCAEALERIDKHDVRALPVISEAGDPVGYVSIFRLGEFFIPKPREPKRMRHVNTSVGAIVRALDADVRNIREEDRVEDLYVRIGAMDIRSFGKFSEHEGVKAEESIIVVGDRWDIQQKALQLGVRLLVITGGLQVDEDILEMARERGVSLIVSNYDSATTTWIIRTATRLKPMVDTHFVSFSPEDKLSHVKRRISTSFAPLYCVLNDAGKLIGIFTKSDILKPIKTRIILVDHNELSQAVTGADEVNIEEIIDHHRLGNPPTHQPILFRNEPLGSTCTIVGNMFRRSGHQPEAPIAGVLMGGIISDTLNLQSPTSTERDREILEWLSKIAGVSADELADTIFKSGSVIVNAEPGEVIRSDCKVYHEGDARYSVSQVEELGYTNFWEHAEELLEALETYRAEEGLLFSALLVTDINSQNSLLLVRGDEGVIDSISYPSTANHYTFDVQGVVSRKKQLIPYLTTLLNGLGVTDRAPTPAG